MHFLGLAGMPRRIPDYAIQFADFNRIVSLGGFLFGVAQLIFVYILIDVAFFKRGAKATAQVWECAKGLEWTIDSPAPHHSFLTQPVVTKSPHEWD